MVVLFIMILFFVGYMYLFSLTNLLNYWYLLWTPVSFICAVLSIVMILIVLYPYLIKSKYNSKIKHKIIHNFIWLVNKISRMKITVEGKNNIPHGRKYVVIGNHKSMLDVLIVYEIFKNPMAAIAKSTLLDVPVLKQLMLSVGCVAIDRGNDREALKSLKQGYTQVENGYPMMVFPEGGIKTRDTEKMVEIKPGAYKLATKPEADIVPIVIQGNSKLSKNAFRRKTKIHVKILKPMTYEDYKDMGTSELGQYFFDLINNEIIE